MSPLWFGLIGLVAGLIGGGLGVGGGLIMVPALVLLGGQAMPRAVGTSLAVVMVVALSGTIRHLQLNHIDWKLAALLGIGAGVGSYFGATLIGKVPDMVARRVFAGFLLIVAIRFAVGK